MGSVADKYKQLKDKHEEAAPEALLRAFIMDEFPGKIALVSSFGIEAALLLDMVAQIDIQTPVIFLDTKKLFPETLSYRDSLIDHLKLQNVKTYYPDYIDTSRDDPNENLWQSSPNMCCFIRKVKPLKKALAGYDAWITGRKQFQGGLRASLEQIEYVEGQIKLNPLALMSAQQILVEYERRNLPRHPLQDQGYTSVGCIPCTALPSDSDNARSGRWQGLDKTECGIHLGEDGKFYRTF